MRRAIPVLLLSATGFVVVWQFEPSIAPAPAVVVPSAEAVAGSAVTTGRGTVQVEVVFVGDRIADVRTLQAPNSSVSRRALPILREEVLRAQSADVDAVSGATMTSEAYTRSLQSALDSRS